MEPPRNTRLDDPRLLGGVVYNPEQQLLFLGRLAREHKAQRFEVLVLSKGGFGEPIVDEARDLLVRVLGCGGDGSMSLPPLLTARLRKAFETFMFSGKAEMGQNFYLRMGSSNSKARVSGEMLVMARLEGVATLHQLAMIRVVNQLSGVDLKKLNGLGLPLLIKEELKQFL